MPCRAWVLLCGNSRNILYKNKYSISRLFIKHLPGTIIIPVFIKFIVDIFKKNDIISKKVLNFKIFFGL